MRTISTIERHAAELDARICSLEVSVRVRARGVKKRVGARMRVFCARICA